MSHTHTVSTRGRSASPTERRLNRRAATRRTGSTGRLMDLLNKEEPAKRRSRGRSRGPAKEGPREEKHRSRSRSRSLTCIVSRLQIEAGINQEAIDEPRSGPVTGVRARRNVSSCQTGSNPPLRRTLSRELEIRRSARQAAKIEIQARDRNQNAIFDQALIRQQRRATADEFLKKNNHHVTSLSPTTDLSKRGTRKTKGTRPQLSARGWASRERTSLAVRKLGEMSDSLSGSWAEWSCSTTDLEEEEEQGSSTGVFEQAERMKNLSATFRLSNRQLQKIPDTAPKRLSREITIPLTNAIR